MESVFNVNQKFIQCKVYNDGNHYIAVPKLKYASKNKGRNSKKTELQEKIEAYYYESLKKNISKSERNSYIVDKVTEEYEEYGEIEDIFDYVDIEKGKIVNKLYNRLKRAKRKAYMNEWNYFVTLTYNDKIHTQSSFEKAIKTSLQHFSSRRGWRYMGGFENGEIGERRHLHLLMYIPENQMVGTLYARHDYSTKQRKIVETVSNSFFEKRFGRCDFQAITKVELESSLDYILKYITKQNEKLMYSKGLLSEIYTYVPECEVACEYTDYVNKLVLFDDSIVIGSRIWIEKSKYYENPYFFTKQMPWIPVFKSLLSAQGYIAYFNAKKEKDKENENQKENKFKQVGYIINRGSQMQIFDNNECERSLTG